jgi:DNA-binding transcriptional LysR family regulator
MNAPDRSFTRRIDLTSLQLFVAVCERGSIGKAAEQEFLATSAVSKRLSDLEATVGSSLPKPAPPRAFGALQPGQDAG